MNEPNRPSGLSVGGPAGIHIHTNRTFAPELRSAHPQLMAQAQRWAVSHGHLAALALTIFGALALVLAAVVIEALTLSRLLYLPAAIASGALWLAAAAVAAVQRRARRGLSAAIERDILRLADQVRGPLTVPATARSLGRSLADVEAALTDMARAGHAIADVDLDTGHLHFAIPTPIRQDRRP